MSSASFERARPADHPPAGRTSAPRGSSPSQRPAGDAGDLVDDDGVLERDALESRADVDGLEALQHRRRQLVKQNAPLAARFKGGTGQGSSSDAARKRHRAIVAKIILATEFQGKTPPSEAALERMANAHEKHIEFCDQLEKDFAKFTVLEDEIASVTERIRDREERLRCWRAEMMLGR